MLQSMESQTVRHDLVIEQHASYTLQNISVFISLIAVSETQLCLESISLFSTLKKYSR